MKFDATLKELQKEKVDLEARLKHVNVAISALAKLSGKETTVPAEQKAATPASTAQPATAAKPGISTSPQTTKPAGA